MTESDRLIYRDGLTDAEVEGLTAYGEARGEPVLGLIAVINVIRNRAAIKKQPPAHMALQTAAFSCWLDLPDHDNALLVELSQKLLANLTMPYDPVFDVCMALAERTDLKDVTGGATHYVNLSVVAAPAWTKPPSVKTVVIGHHTFYTHVAF